MMKSINKTFYGLSLFSAFILLVMLVLLDVLPTLYFAGIIVTIVFVYIILGVLCFKIKNKIGNIILIILEFLLGGICLFASNKIYETNDFLEAVNTNKKENIIYYVMVNKNSTNHKINDIMGKELGTYLENDKNREQVLEKLNKKVETYEKKYNNLSTLGNELLQNKIDAILVSGFHKERLEEQKEFKKSTKVLYKIKISLTKKETSDLDIVKNPFSIYISGIDTNGPINTVSRSDVNIVVTVNPKTREILMTFIPRDYYVTLSGTSGPKDKLTHAGLYGIDMSVATIEDLLNIKIDYYIRVNFDTLVNVVDTIGGVDVYSDMDFKTYKGYIKKGYNHLNGEEALAFSRERKYFAEGDRKRGEHQEEVIRAILNKVTSSTVMLTNYSSILKSLNNTFETSIPTSEIKKFVKMQLKDMPKWNITTLNLDGVGSNANTYSIPNESLYVMIPDEKTVTKAQEAIHNLKKAK